MLASERYRDTAIPITYKNIWVVVIETAKLRLYGAVMLAAYLVCSTWHSVVRRMRCRIESRAAKDWLICGACGRSDHGTLSRSMWRERSL